MEGARKAARIGYSIGWNGIGYRGIDARRPTRPLTPGRVLCMVRQSLDITIYRFMPLGFGG